MKPVIRSILIIDDSPADQLLTQMTIEKYDKNITILQAYDGREGLSILAAEQAPPDIILLDINMPGMNGHDFLDEYNQSSGSSCVVIMLTSSILARDKEKCMKYDFVKRYFDKPLEMEHLEDLSGLV